MPMQESASAVFWRCVYRNPVLTNGHKVAVCFDTENGCNEDISAHVGGKSIEMKERPEASWA